MHTAVQIRKSCRRHIAAIALLLVLMVSALPVRADEEHSAVAGKGEMASTKEVAKYGMTPISGDQVKDGTYDIKVRSSSQFFRVEKAELTVKKGKMTAALTMSTYSYSLLYMGTAKKAAAAPASDYIKYEEIGAWYVFTVPVEALDKAIDCASFSDNRKKWYNRKILFDATTLPEDALKFELPDYDRIEEAMEQSGTDTESVSGTSSDSGTEEGTASGNGPDSKISTDEKVQEYIRKYNLEPDDDALKTADPADTEGIGDGDYSIALDMAGGSGRAQVSTPTYLTIKDGKAYATLLWSSPNYDWMIVGGKVYTNETTDGGNSSFTIPIAAFDRNIPIIADTTAMGDPVPIDYILVFYRDSIGSRGLIPQIAAQKVIVVAVIIIAGGFFLNLFVKRRRKHS